MLVDFDVSGHQEMDFLTGERTRTLPRSESFKVKTS